MHVQVADPCITNLQVYRQIRVLAAAVDEADRQKQTDCILYVLVTQQMYFPPSHLLAGKCRAAIAGVLGAGGRT